MGIKKLTVENAQIKTASVEVKTLTISGKQVTLAVFRQLEDEHVLDEETCEPLGIVWGRINYHPDKSCAELGDHIHLVWQKGNELRRCALENYRATLLPLSLERDAGWGSDFRVRNHELRKHCLEGGIKPSQAKYEAWKAAYKAFWEYCNSLDQLFIAV